MNCWINYSNENQYGYQKQNIWGGGEGRSKESIMTLPFFKEKNELKKTKSQIVKDVCSRSEWLGYW